ncbi:MAG: hypothetical protein HY794_15615 [Desulfarculus sp.]|nr:hypothetical protein [Desulfarculus sp.]
MLVRRVAILIREPGDAWEGLRSALGLMVENLVADCYFIGASVKLPAGKTPGDFQDSLELLADLDGQCFTDNPADAESYRLLTHASLEQMAARLPGYGLVIPF